MEAKDGLTLSESEELSQPKKSSFLNSMVDRLKTQLRPLLGLIIITIVFMVFAPTYRQWPAIRDIL